MANGMRFSRTTNEMAARLAGGVRAPRIIDPRRIAAPQIAVQMIGQWAVRGVTPQGPATIGAMPLVMMAFDVGTPRARADALDVKAAREFAAGIIKTCDELEVKPEASSPPAESASAEPANKD